MADIKKFLDSNGLTYFCKKFQDYPSNEILGAVINAIDTTKLDKDSIVSNSDIKNLILTGGAASEENLSNYPVRYYRIEFNKLYRSDTAKTDPISACLTEIEFYDDNNNKINISSIVADSVYDKNYDPNKLYDNDFSTMWSSLNKNGLHWLEICLDGAAVISKILIAPRSNIKWGVPDTITFFASETGDDWKEIGYYENLKDTWIDQNTFQEFSLNPYKLDASTSEKIISFNGLRYYHNRHGILKANINSPVFTGSPSANTPEITDNSTRLATTEFVQKLFSDTKLENINKELSAKAHKQRMEEWKNLGLGLFIHWGVYSAWDGKWSGTNELGEEVDIDLQYNAEWLLCRSKMPPEVYKEKSNNFTGELWNAEEIAKMAYQAGMKYIVITSKHHEGFSLFPNENSSWDINDTPCRNTILQELKDACDRYGLKFCLYFSQCYDWTEEGGFGKETSQYLGSDPWTEEQHMAYMEKTINSIKYLVETYDPFVLWYDMGYSDKKYSNILYEAQETYWPNVIVNDRLASNRNLYGDFRTTERVPGDGTNEYSEACFTLNNTWGYNSSNDVLKSYNSMNLETIFKTYIIESIGNKQNCLLNIGPKPDGSIPTMQKSRLKFMANFFKKYGILAGAQSTNKISYPNWGYMLKINDTTLRCFIYEPNQSNINLYGFDPTYIKSVRVFGAENEYSDNNYEITEYGIKLLVDKLNSYSYDEFIPDFNTTITNNANIGVVEINFSQPTVILDAKPINVSEIIEAKCFSVKNNYVTKSSKSNQIKLAGNGNCYTEFIWLGDTGYYNLNKSITAVDDISVAGTITISNIVNKTEQIIELDNLATDEINENILLKNGFRYGIQIKRIGGDSKIQMIFSRISFEPSSDIEITYTEVDHITAKSFQYIDTGFIPSSNTKVEIDVMQTAKSSNGCVIVGLENPKFIIGIDKNSSKIRFDYGDFKEQYTPSTYNILNTRHLLALDKGKCYVDGEEIVELDLSSSSSFTGKYPLHIFNDSQYDPSHVRFLGNIYSAKIWENDELVRDFIPVKRDYDGIYGLLDKVNNKFYRSMTSIDFTCE